MAVTYTPNLKLNKPDDGEKPWGIELRALADLSDEAISGFLSKAITGSVSMTIDDGATSEIRHKIIKFTGTLTGDATITVPAIEKTWIMQNLTTGGFKLIIKTAAGVTADLLAGDTAEIFCDGTDCFNLSALANTLTGVEFATGGTAIHKPMGVISSQFTPVGNVGAGEDDLMSFSIPANTLDTNGKALRVTAWGTTATAGKNITLKFHFGATAITLVDNRGDDNWRAEFMIIRDASNSQETVGFIKMELADFDERDRANIASPSETDTGAIIVKFTGENITDAVNDAIIQTAMLIELLN